MRLARRDTSSKEEERELRGTRSEAKKEGKKLLMMIALSVTLALVIAAPLWRLA
jgi:hypothetical protein